jgi:TRAP-type C4-dicarboxylate transport system substrate-binding protein
LARVAVTQAAADTEIRQFRAIETRAGENVARMLAHGVTIAEAPAVRAALAQAAAPVIADWVNRAGAEGAAILAAYRASP